MPLGTGLNLSATTGWLPFLGGEQPPWSEIANYDHIYFHYRNVVVPLHIAYIVQFFLWVVDAWARLAQPVEIRRSDRDEMGRENEEITGFG